MLLQNPNQSLLDFLITGDSVDLEEKRKRRVYIIFLILSIPTFLGFGISHLITGNYQFGMLDVGISSVLSLSFLLLRKMQRGIYLYRFICLVVGLNLLTWIYHGPMEVNPAIWLVCFPLLAFSFLEKNEGLIWTTLVYVICLILFTVPNQSLPYDYSFSFKFRFSGIFILLTFFLYAYESVRIEFWNNLLQKQQSLEKEIEERKAAESALLKAQTNLESRIETGTRELHQTNQKLQREIQERHAVEGQLQISKKRFRDFADLLPQAIFELDDKGKLLYLNQFGLNAIGLNQNDLLKGIYADELFIEENSEQIKRNIDLIINNQPPVGNEFGLRGNEGEVLSVLIHARRTKINSGAIGVRGVVTDATERKAFEKELMHAKEAADSAAIAKNNFLIHMSHELRTPMNGVLGVADLLSYSELSDQQTQYLETISQSGKALLKILNDILDLSRVKANKLAIDSVEFNLRKVITNVENLFSAPIVMKGLDFQLTIDEAIPGNLVGDPIRLGQVLTNALSNAEKFTEQGQISLNITLKQETESSVVLVFTIQDTGIGIAKEDLTRIFESFSQVDSSTTRKYGGAGLGLTVIKQIIEVMNGDLCIESQKGEGTNLRIELPFNKGRSNEDAQWEKKHIALNRVLKPEDFIVLVVDDDYLSRHMNRDMLEKMGYRVKLAASGNEALNKLDQDLYSLVLMDCTMPDMDGFETTRLIRQKKFKGSFSSLVPIIALTAKTTEQEREHCLEAGMNDVLRKPVSFAHLKQVLEKSFSWFS